MGCGIRNFGKEWVHIDGGEHSHLDYNSIVDLKQFQDNSVDLIYASHVIEYFDREEIITLLTEWKRILKKSATLRIAVPDFGAMAKLYLNSAYPLDNFLGPLYGKMEMSGSKIYHKTVYDFDSLQRILEFCGFSDVKRYDWKNTEHNSIDDHSQAYLPHMDKENGTLISLNMECIK